MVHVAISIVAHVKRQSMAKNLATQIAADFISIDNGALGYANHHRVWRECAALQQDWCLVVEDDAVPVHGFISQAQRALEVAPSPVVSLYLGRDKRTTHALTDAVDKAQANDASWIMHTKLLHAVAVAVRSELVPHMLAYCERKRYLPIDDAISGWRARHLLKQHVAYTAPSLVDHRDTPTVIEHRRDNIPRDYPRKAFRIGARQHWNSSSVTV